MNICVKIQFNAELLAQNRDNASSISHALGEIKYFWQYLKSLHDFSYKISS